MALVLGAAVGCIGEVCAAERGTPLFRDGFAFGTSSTISAADDRAFPFSVVGEQPEVRTGRSWLPWLVLGEWSGVEAGRHVFPSPVSGEGPGVRTGSGATPPLSLEVVRGALSTFAVWCAANSAPGEATFCMCPLLLPSRPPQDAHFVVGNTGCRCIHRASDVRLPANRWLLPIFVDR